MKQKKLLPPLDYLRAFEAAAIHGSFAGAARSLSISETSISRKVRLLELHYDVPLFVRGHRSITLTPQGERLLAPVRNALDHLREASRGMLAQAGRDDVVNLAATNSVASLWLMPRLRRFTRANPRVRIRLTASDNDAECLGDGIDLAILRGDGDWPGYSARMLFGETVFPVCSPDYLRRHPEAATLEGLRKLDLIEIANQHTEWMNWRGWLEAQDAAAGPVGGATVFNTYPLAIQAAADGLGIALGWGHLVDRMLENGELVRPVGDVNARTHFGYYLLRREDRESFPELRIVADWLLAESAARQRYGARPVGDSSVPSQGSDEAIRDRDVTASQSPRTGGGSPTGPGPSRSKRERET
ncbi:LysR family transcriptional regulator [Roseovarius sp. SCSIO 43702]|uniref:LysR substrate-binding domain-containing protein n=1 Tax=Roseovarius sp. SCSIO 43702 TaxID=2823043 RepID=UPI001C72BA16|nr:LysR substrate-binding domain-containing protein [Roseovarius sp. SCSIO 43702]QYX55265.1 LysR family transcriptional regulator [Roseovarius sp. SCSIO 43702]